MVGAGARGAPLLPPVLLLPLLLRGAAGGIADSVVWAVNAGGDAHVDVNGIHFRKDPLEGRVGRGEGGGHTPRPGGFGGTARGVPLGSAPLGLRGPAVPAASGTRSPPAPSCPLQPQRVCGCPCRTARAPLPQPPRDGRGPKAAPAEPWPGSSRTPPAGPSRGRSTRPRGGAGPGPQRRRDEPCGMVFLSSACGVV